ncbi:MAG: 8-oxo-dGTP pyrophosphatase MutT (NUDIX family) [Acidimicrobiales bacterium]
MTSGFRHLRDELIHQGAVVATYDGWFEGPDGQEFRRDVVRHPGAVSAVAIEDDQIFLVHQYRAPIDLHLWEIPAGKLDVAGEPPEQTVVRELEEEIGRRPGRLDHLLDFHHSPGFCDELQHIFLARDLTPVPQRLDGLEEQHMVVELVPFAVAVDMATDGRITDGKSIAGILAAARVLGH